MPQAAAKLEFSVRKKCLFSLVALLIIFTGIEGAVRLLYFLRHRNPDYLIWGLKWGKVNSTYAMFDDVLGYRLKPGGHFFEGVINEMGWRGRPFTKEKTDHVVRILALGESTTFGFKNSEEGTYPKILERFLNNGHQRDTVEVLNLGVPGYDSNNVLRLVEEYALGLHPDALLLYMGLNDWVHAVQAGPHWKEGLLRVELLDYSPFWMKFQEWLVRRSLCLMVLREKGGEFVHRHIRYAPIIFSGGFGDRYLEKQAERMLHDERVFLQFERNIRTIAQKAKRRKISVFLVKPPLLFQNRQEFESLLAEQGVREGSEMFSQSYLAGFEKNRQILEKLSREEGISLIDVSGAFSALSAGERMGCFNDFVHPNNRGNELSAKVMSRVLQQEVQIRQQWVMN